MAPTSKLFFLITILQLSNAQWFNELYPYPRDIITEFPPVRFPGPESVGDVSGLQQKLSNVQEQLRAVKLAKSSTSAGSTVIGFVPVTGGLLKSVTGALANHLLSVTDLEKMSTDLKFQLSMKEAFAKHSLSHFTADARALQGRIRELTGNSSTEVQRLSAIPAIHVCEKILELFRDETYMFWELKMIFYPHLLSFTGLYATAAAATAQLLPDNLASLQEEMDRLRETILKYHPVVKEERLSKLAIKHFHVNSTGEYEDEVHWRNLLVYCPVMQFLLDRPASYNTTCIRGHSVSMLSPQSESNKRLYRRKLEVEPSLQWFTDTQTGEVICGWAGCWNAWNQYMGNAIDNLTTSALELIPFNKPTNLQLPAPKKDFLQCKRDEYGRLAYPKSIEEFREKGKSGVFGCRKGYCWADCDWGWCYTRSSEREEYARCEKTEDCCIDWECYGRCGIL